jgi:hypothetical protein
MKYSNTMKLFLIFILLTFTKLSNAQNSEQSIRNEIEKIKIIPSYHHTNMIGDSVPQTIYDSSFSKIVDMGVKVIPTLLKLLKDTSVVKIINPCFDEKKMRMHDIGWFLIRQIEPFPFHAALNLQFCIEGDCDHFPQGFFNFIHSNPTEYSVRYEKYFYSRVRKKYLKSNKY